MTHDSKYTVLIVEDEETNHLILNQILASEYGIFSAKSGEEGLKLAGDFKPDLIILDIVLPDIYGYDVLVKLKENPDTRNIPVIIITGLDNERDEERGLILGAVDYIIKPFKHQIVKARIHTHMAIVRQMRAIEKLGLTDPLTGIANRRSFDDRLEMEWRRAIREKKPISFLMMDLDKFKKYNDTYGHSQGDTLLKEAAKIFTVTAKRPADLPVRLGGEEFGILLPDTKLESAIKIAESIRINMEALKIPTLDGETMTKATISIGVVAALPKENDSSKTFLTTADEHLYLAKASGRNRVCCEKHSAPKENHSK
jgi:diguanylate cyclase (GGDEF)-like protein